MAFLSHIENPRGLFLKLAYMVSRRQYKKVISPLAVAYARAPGLLPVTMKIVSTREKKLSVPHGTDTLISAMTSFLNGCSFCEDLHLAEAMKKKLGTEKFKNLGQYKTSNAFSESEKVMLAYVEEVTTTRKASQESVEKMKKHFSEKQIVEIAWLIAIGNYFNFLAKSLGLSSDELAESFK